MERQTLSIEEAARLLGIGRSSAYEAARRDALPVRVLRIGRRFLVPRAPLERLLRGEEQPQDTTGGG
jgi:excisionase family DNA binding protein